MTSVNMTPQTVTPLVSSAMPQGAVSQGAATSGDSASQATSTTVNISGKAMMLSRLFSGGEPGYSSISNQHDVDSGSVYKFLNPTDRVFIAKAYEFAQANHIDPAKVDYLAFDMGYLRSSSKLVDPTGYMFDMNGNAVANEFNPDDEKIAQQLLTSNALKDTEVPQDMLRKMLDPGLAPTHATDFNFLQKLVYAFSASGSDGSTDPAAAIPPRSKERLAAMQAAGMIPSPEEVRKTVIGQSVSVSIGTDQFSLYASRIDKIAGYLSPDDKTTLGRLYALAEKNGTDMKKIDHLASQLAVMRLTTQYLSTLVGDDEVSSKAQAGRASSV